MGLGPVIARQCDNGDGAQEDVKARRAKSRRLAVVGGAVVVVVVVMVSGSVVSGSVSGTRWRSRVSTLVEQAAAAKEPLGGERV